MPFTTLKAANHGGGTAAGSLKAASAVVFSLTPEESVPKLLYPPDQHAYIYALSDPVTRKVRYVGKTFDVPGRYKGHLKDRDGSHKANWIQSLLRAGMKPEVDVVEICSPDKNEEWEAAERKWISVFRAMGFPLTNLMDGGGSGGRHSPETRRKISQIKLNASPEVKERIGRAISNSKMGYKHSPEACAKLKAAALNRSPEHLAKLRAAASNVSDETRDKMRRSALAMSDEKKRAISEAVKLRHKDGCFKNAFTPEAIEKGAAKRRGQKRTQETRDKISQSKQNLSAETREKMRQSALAMSDEKKRNIAATVSRRYKEGAYKNAHTPETHAKISAALKGHSFSVETLAKMSAKTKAMHQDPEYKAAFEARFKGKKRDPLIVAKIVAAMKAGREARKAEAL